MMYYECEQAGGRGVNVVGSSVQATYWPLPLPQVVGSPVTREKSYNLGQVDELHLRNIPRLTTLQSPRSCRFQSHSIRTTCKRNATKMRMCTY